MPADLGALQPVHAQAASEVVVVQRLKDMVRMAARAQAVLLVVPAVQTVILVWMEQMGSLAQMEATDRMVQAAVEEEYRADIGPEIQEVMELLVITVTVVAAAVVEDPNPDFLLTMVRVMAAEEEEQAVAAAREVMEAQQVADRLAYFSTTQQGVL